MTMRQQAFLIVFLYFVAIVGALSICHAQSAERTCRYGWKTVCRTDSGGHTICTTRCR